MIHLRYFDRFINEAVRPEEVDSYFKKYDELKAKGINLVNPVIKWKAPDDDYIVKEINEIPENLATNVLDNIDTITRQVKQKLLADQQGVTS